MSTKKLQILGSFGNKVYTQPDEPTDAVDGSVWIDLDETALGNDRDADTLDGKHASEFAAVDHAHDVATSTAAGFMSAADKTKLDGIATGATKVTVDSALSSTSTNPVQNKVVNTAISNLNTLVGDTSVSSQINTALKSVPQITYGTADLTAGTSTLATGAIYLVYEVV